MTNPINKKSINKLSRSLKRCKGNYAFLIGAGTSSAAGIKTSGELIDQWSSKEYNVRSRDLEKSEWAEKREEKIPDYQNSYGYWFETRYTTREERRKFIKELVEDAEPTFEHIVLSSLMSENYVPIALTPNFDDLLYDAFYLYIQERPFMVDHNAIAPQFKITHDDPMIVKLHGDYLYDNLKNTASETSELEENVNNVLRTTLNEYGLIVLGYGGKDESIMNVLTSDDFEIPDYGLFWCARNGDELSPEVEKLLKKENTFLVEIDSSKEFFYELYDNLEDLNVPTPMDIQEQASRRAKQLKEGIMEVGGVEVLGLASEYRRRDEYDNAIEILSESVKSGDESPAVFDMLGRIYAEDEQYEKAIRHFNKSIETYKNDKRNILEDDDVKLRRESPIINSRALAKSRLGRFSDAAKDFEYVVENNETSTNYNNLSEALILSGNIEEGVEKAKKGRELAERRDNEISSVLMLTVAEILENNDNDEFKQELKELTEEPFVHTWHFEEVEYFLKHSNITEEKSSEIEEAVRLYKDSKEIENNQGTIAKYISSQKTI